MDKILWRDHSNEISSAVQLHGTVCFLIFYRMTFRIFLEFWFIAFLPGVTGFGKFVAFISKLSAHFNKFYNEIFTFDLKKKDQLKFFLIF